MPRIIAGLINTQTRTLEKCTFEQGRLADIYELLKIAEHSRCVTTIQLTDALTIFVDDEGALRSSTIQLGGFDIIKTKAMLYSGNKKATLTELYSSPLIFGFGLICLENSEGDLESIDERDLKTIGKQIYFY